MYGMCFVLKVSTADRIECIRDPCLVLTILTYIVIHGTVAVPAVSGFSKTGGVLKIS